MAPTQLFKIDDLVFDKKIYPRNSISWFIWIKYAGAMKSGSLFPPIKVAKKGGKFFVLDGWHRTEARKYNKEKTVEGEIIDLPKENWLREAKIVSIRLNTDHGNALSSQDRARAISELQKLGLQSQKIAEIVHIPVKEFKRFVADRMTVTPAGKEIFIKKSFRHLKGAQIRGIPNDVEGKLSGQSQWYLLDQLVTIIENDLLDTENKSVMMLVGKLRKIL